MWFTVKVVFKFLIWSFLSNKDWQLSSSFPILSGVAGTRQLSIGPVLFNVFINDITDLFSGGTCVKHMIGGAME